MKKLLLSTWLVVLFGFLAVGFAQVQGPLPPVCAPAVCSTPHIMQVASVVNPVTNRIHLFGVTDNGRILQFEQRLGQWIDLDQSEAGYVDSPVRPGTPTVVVTSPHFRQVEAVVNPATNKIHLFGVTSYGVVLQYNAQTGQWVDLDQSDAGFLD